MTKEIKLTGPVIHASPILHGRRVKLIRSGKKVNGVLLSQDSQTHSDNLIFQWINEDGVASISPLTGEELEALLSG